MRPTRRFIAVLFFVAMISTLIPVSAKAAVDNVPPEIKKFKVSSSTVKPGDTVNFEFDIVEEGTGASEIMAIFLNSADGDTRFANPVSVEDALYNNPAYTGHVTIPVKITSDHVPGDYTLYEISTYDCAGNHRVYSCANDQNGSYFYPEDDPTIKRYADDPDDYQISIINENYQYTSGLTETRVRSCRLLTEKAKGGSTINVDMEMEHFSPVDIFLFFDHSGGQFCANYFAYNSVQHNGSLYHYQFTVPELNWLCNGSYSISSMFIRDSNNRERHYNLNESGDSRFLVDESDGSVCSLSGYSVLEYFEDEKKDKKSPTLENAKIQQTSVFRPGVVTVNFTISDETELGSVYYTIDRGDRTYALGESVNLQQKHTKKYTGAISAIIDRTCPLGSYDVNMTIYDAADNMIQRRIGTITIEDEFDVAFDCGVNNPKLLENVQALKTGETGRIFLTASQNKVPAKLFKAIKGRNVNLLFSDEYYQWIFNGKDISLPKDIIVNLVVSPLDPGDGTGIRLVMTLPENGILPGKAQVRVKSGILSEIYSYTGALYLYYQNEKTKEDELITNCHSQFVREGDNAWCYFDITHNSTYYLAGRKHEEANIDHEEVYLTKDVIQGVEYQLNENPKTAVAIRLDNKRLKKIEIPKTIFANGRRYKIIGIKEKCFKNNTRITSVKIGSNVKTIGNEAFRGCKKLSSVKMGANITTIGENAFLNCKSLKKITIPSKVSKIGTSAFSGCRKLKSITIKTKKLKAAAIGKHAFKKVPAKAVVKVPKSKKKLYKKLLRKRGLSKKAVIK